MRMYLMPSRAAIKPAAGTRSVAAFATTCVAVVGTAGLAATARPHVDGPAMPAAWSPPV